MPRHNRNAAPGEAAHVMSRGLEGLNIFHDDLDRSRFFTRLKTLTEELDVRCLAAALQWTHLHLVLVAGEATIAEFMHRLLTGYTVEYRLRYGGRGPIVADRYKRRLILDDYYLVVVIRYVLLNPVESGIVRSLEELIRYPWVTLGDLLGLRTGRGIDVETALNVFGPDPARARAALREWVDVALRSPDIATKIAALEAVLEEASPAGSIATFQSASALQKASERARRRETRLAAGWTAENIVTWICRLMSVNEYDLCAGARDRATSEARSIAAFLARHELGSRGRDLATQLGVGPSAITAAVERGRDLVHDQQLELPPAPLLLLASGEPAHVRGGKLVEK